MVLKKLLVLQKMQNSKVARNNETEEGETAKDDVLVVEEDDNVPGVRREGGDTEKKECKWLEVPQMPGFGLGFIALIKILVLSGVVKSTFYTHFYNILGS